MMGANLPKSLVTKKALKDTGVVKHLTRSLIKPLFENYVAMQLINIKFLWLKFIVSDVFYVFFFKTLLSLFKGRVWLDMVVELRTQYLY